MAAIQGPNSPSPPSPPEKPVVIAEETSFSSVMGAIARSSAVKVVRSLPHIPAAKFFRPKSTSVSATKPTPFHGQVTHFLWHVSGGVVLFGMYSFGAKYLWTNDSPDSERIKPAHAFLAGAMGGTAYCTLIHPFYNLHSARLLPCHGQATMWQSWRSLFTEARTLGKWSILKGFTATLFYDAVGYGLFFLAYEVARQQMDSTYKNYAHDSHQPKQLILEPALHAAIAGCCAGLALELVHFPIHNAQYAVAARTNESPRLVSLIRAAAELKASSLAAAYKGFVPHAVRALPSSAAAFLAYEMSLLWARQVADRHSESESKSTDHTNAH